jgi:hypothetical protein
LRSPSAADRAPAPDVYPTPFSIPWASAPATATPNPLPPLQTAELQATGLTGHANLNHPVANSESLIGTAIGFVTEAPTLVESVGGSPDHVGPPLRSEGREEKQMPPELSSSSGLVNGSWDQLSGTVEQNALFKSASSDLSPVAAAAYYRESVILEGAANRATIKVWSKAVIYTYASRGIMCQAGNLTIVTSSGGTPNCLDLFSYDTRDGAQVRPAS